MAAWHLELRWIQYHSEHNLVRDPGPVKGLVISELLRTTWELDLDLYSAHLVSPCSLGFSPLGATGPRRP